MATNVRDPRSVITPEAFEIDTALLGTPLAAPGRRLWALLVDLIVIGILTVVTNSVALFLWGGVALFLVSMAFRGRKPRTPRKATSGPDVTSILFRGATGCLGLVILMGVGIGFLATRFDDFTPEDLESLGVDISPGDEFSLGEVVRGLGGMGRLRQARDTAEAREALEGMTASLRRAGVPAADLEEALGELRELAPDDAEWTAEWEVVVERVLASAAEPEEAPPPTRPVDEEVAGLTDAEAFAAYAELAAADSVDEARARALRVRLLPVVAADTLETLAEALDDVRDDLEDTRGDLAGARAEIEAAGSGFFELLRDIWDQAGSAIGLWSVYFTVVLTLTRGRTVGKKILGLRVVRLDGQPITWWFAFERAGGYVAGIATGLLGFAQVFWDPNRQCVHDKIGGTVVVVDGAKPIPGAWEEAWTGPEEGK